MDIRSELTGLFGDFMGFQAVRFRLNTASNQGKIMMNEREFSLWVGDLSPEVDDYTLFKCFAAKYQSIKAAKGKSIFIISIAISQVSGRCSDH